MNNQELDKLLKSVRVPEETPEFREELASRVSRTLRQPQCERFTDERPRFAARNWAMGAVAVAAVVLLALLVNWDSERAKSDDAFARAEKCFREVESLFPNQVRAMVFGMDGPRLEISEHADVPDSPAVYLKICGPRGCHEVVTLSGQQVRVNGELCDVLLDSSGKILVVGQKLVYSGGQWSVGTAHYRIEARPLKVTT